MAKPMPVTTENPNEKSIFGQDPETFRDSSRSRMENRRFFLEWITENLVQGVDFTYWNDSAPPTLHKPGATKIQEFLGLRVDFPERPGHERRLQRCGWAELAEDPDLLMNAAISCEAYDQDGRFVARAIGQSWFGEDGRRAIYPDDFLKIIETASDRAFIKAMIAAGFLSGQFVPSELTDIDP